MAVLQSSKYQFIECISEMNTKSLENILIDNAFRKYSNSSFLEKLNELFTKFKESGNTRLEIHKGVGVCRCNKDKKIFCFVGNKTNDYFTLGYQEDENNYYNFSTSCDEILFDNPPQLNTFYYFSIKPEDTLEYKVHQESSTPIAEYKTLSTNGVCSMRNIGLWLEKYAEFYNTTLKVLEVEKYTSKLNSVELLVKKEFENLYGKLSILKKLYKKESYFKQQLETYNKVKDSISKLEKWFKYQQENKREYELFSALFYDSRELTHFALKLDELTLDTKDFKHTLEYMSIIENAQAIEFKGTIKTISDLEVFEKTSTTRAYTQQVLVISIKNFCCSAYQIVFRDGRVKHLENLCVGQYVKVFARLTGGELERSESVKKYSHNLYGWRVEKIVAKPKIKHNNEDMDLYHKYIFPFPF